MTIREKILAALAGTGVPPYFGGWAPAQSGDAPPDVYLVFTTMSRPAESADNRRRGWLHYAYLNLWAKGSNAAARVAVLTAMEGAGFSCVDITEDWEEDTRMSRCAMTFFTREAV